MVDSPPPGWKYISNFEMSLIYLESSGWLNGMTFIKLVSEKVENASMPAGPINKWVKTKNSGCKWDFFYDQRIGCPWWKITNITIQIDTE